MLLESRWLLLKENLSRIKKSPVLKPGFFTGGSGGGLVLHL
jgi:hypothetical protein